MNDKIKKLLTEVENEDQKYKVCLIEDIMKASKFLYAMGDSGYSDAVFKPEVVFDGMYDKPINDLQIIDALLNDKCTKAMQVKMDLIKSIRHEN